MLRALCLGIGLFLLAGLTACPPSSPINPYANLLVVERGSEGEYRYAYPICAGDAVILSWQLIGVSRGTLSAYPPSATVPVLDNRSIDNQGELSIRVLEPFTLELKHKGGSTERIVELETEDLCTGFPLPPLGIFTGTLEQRLPTVQTLARQLILRRNGRVIEAELSTGLEEDYTLLSLICSANSIDDTLVCSDDLQTPTFRLEANVIATGLTGTYQGITKNATSSTPFSGTFTFAPSP